MEAGIWLTIGALLVAAASLVYTARAANAARHQTTIQQQLREDAAQPYVWADIRPSPEHAQLLLLVVGNSGPTVATDVRITVTPPITAGKRPADRSERINAALREGITALPPGRQMAWSLGVPHVFLEGLETAKAYRFEIEALGPFGPTPPLTYTVDLEALRFTLAVPSGTLHGVRLAVDELVKEVRQQVELSRRAQVAEEGD